MPRPKSPPQLAPGSPAPPPDAPRLAAWPRPISLVVDTNVLFTGDIVPIWASARAGDLAVFWSMAIQREAIKVAYRSSLLRHTRVANENETLASVIRRTFSDTARAIEDVFRLLEPVFRLSPDAEIGEDFPLVPDPADRVLFRAARAAKVPFLVTLNQHDLPHGQYLYGVQCWHPDTFMTTLYQHDPDAYARAVALLGDTTPMLSLAPLLRRRPLL